MATCGSSPCNQTYHGGPGCQAISCVLNGETAVSWDTVDTAGDIACYYFQCCESPSADYDIRFALHSSDNGIGSTTWSLISGTDSGTITNGISSGVGGCYCFEDGVDYTATTTAATANGDECVVCYMENKQGVSGSGGAGVSYKNNNDACGSTGWNPSSQQSGWDCTFGVEIAAAAGESYTASGSLTPTGAYTRKLTAKRTVSGEI